MQSSLDEPSSRRTLREVVALSALPSIWVGKQPLPVAESLAEVLLSALPLNFVYFRLRGEDNGSETEVVRTGRVPFVAGQLREISQALAPWLNNGATTLPHTIPNPVGSGVVRLLRAPLGPDGGEGVVVAGSQQPDFPGEDDRLLLSFGANQAGIVLKRSRAERQLRESEARFHAICDQAVLGIAQVDLTGRFLFANDRYLQTLGYTRTELLQMRMQDITHPADLPTNLAQFHALAEGGPDYLIEKRYICKDGSVLWVRNHVNGIRDLSGKVTSSVAISVDITDQRRHEEALQASEARYRIFVDHATDGLFLYDGDGLIVDVNRQACESLGYSRDELIGKTPATFDPDVTPEIVAYRMARLAAGETIAFDARHRRKDGSTVPVEVRVRPFEVDGKFYALSLAHDISERTKSEEALRNNAKQLRDLSRRLIDVQEEERRYLARELHDEIGQILSAISVNLHALNVVSDTASKSRLDESISIVDRAIHQVHNLSLDLRPSMLDELGLVSTIRWFAGRQAQRAGLELEFVADSSGERLPADLEITCYRVVQEALTNVVRHAQAQHVQVEFRQQEEEVQLLIRDDGIGFNLEAVQRGSARGASFGVLGMKERVDLLGGQIEFMSEPGHGTSLHVHFPLASQPTSNIEPQARQRR